MNRWLLLSLLLCGCGDETDEPAEPELLPEVLFSSAITRVEVEVDYADGAAPFTGSAGSLDDLWELTEASIDALFGGTKELVIPHGLDEMEAVGPLEGSSFTRERVIELTDLFWDHRSEGNTATIYVLFVDGYHEEDGVVDEDVLGVNYGKTGVITMFKPAMASFTGLSGKHAEQSVLIHEIGHAAGLVNDGIPLTSEHHDVPNGAHCTQEDCVMYHEIDGKKGIKEFVQTQVQDGDLVLFGPECIDDGLAALGN